MENCSNNPCVLLWQRCEDQNHQCKEILHLMGDQLPRCHFAEISWGINFLPTPVHHTGEPPATSLHANAQHECVVKHMCHASAGNCRHPAGKKNTKKSHKGTSYRNSRQYSFAFFFQSSKTESFHFASLPQKKVLKGFPFGLVGNYGYIQRITLQPTQVLTKMWQRAGNVQ